MNPIFIINNLNGKTQFENKEAFVDYVKSLGNGKVEVVAKKKRKPRSTGKQDELGNQNGWYWSVILPISAKNLGYTVKEMHEVFTEEFAPYTTKDFNGKVIKLKIRTSEMDTMQFTEYTNSIIIKMAEMGCIIPEPDKIK